MMYPKEYRDWVCEANKRQLVAFNNVLTAKGDLAFWQGQQRGNNNLDLTSYVNVYNIAMQIWLTECKRAQQAEDAYLQRKAKEAGRVFMWGRRNAKG